MPKPSPFVWYELITSDAAAAESFYRDVVGWGAQQVGGPGMAYTMLTVGDVPTAGLMAIPESCAGQLKPGWTGYIAVEDVDAAAAAVRTAGGQVSRGPDDIPGVGRFASVADPQGATFNLFRPLGNMAPPPSPAPGTPGTPGWHELYAADWQAVFPFYAELFGWAKDMPVDMGPMGIYQLFNAGGPPIGGMMTRMGTVPAPVWNYYFHVTAIDPAVARIQTGGGQVTNGPHEVPGGSWIVQGLDPQGLAFALVGPKG